MPLLPTNCIVKESFFSVTLWVEPEPPLGIRASFNKLKLLPDFFTNHGAKAPRFPEKIQEYPKKETF